MRLIETYCPNIQICAKVEELSTIVFTEVYCNKNKCDTCPFHPNNIKVTKTKKTKKGDEKNGIEKKIKTKRP